MAKHNTIKIGNIVLKADSPLLDLYHQNIWNQHLEELVQILECNPHITWLNLGQNFIDCHGARVLADILKTNNNIDGLDLSNNYIGNIGATSISAALKSNKKLRYLNLGNNEINDEGVDIVVQDLKHNTTLSSIHINNNFITKHGGLALYDLVVSNVNITHLVVEGVGNAIIADIKSMLTANIMYNEAIESYKVAFYIAYSSKKMVTSLLTYLLKDLVDIIASYHVEGFIDCNSNKLQDHLKHATQIVEIQNDARNEVWLNHKAVRHCLAIRYPEYFQNYGEQNYENVEVAGAEPLPPVCCVIL